MIVPLKYCLEVHGREVMMERIEGRRHFNMSVVPVCSQIVAVAGNRRGN